MQIIRQIKILKLFSILVLFSGLMACGGGGGGSSNGDTNSPGNSNQSSKARFVFDCNIEGLNGVLTMEVEAVGSAGIVWGSGPNPNITGVIGTGDVIYFTAGELVTPTARYIFTGDNDFADFTGMTTMERFRVRWLASNQGLTIEVNPFGAPTYYSCVQTGSEFI